VVECMCIFVYGYSISSIYYCGMYLLFLYVVYLFMDLIVHTMYVSPAIYWYILADIFWTNYYTYTVLTFSPRYTFHISIFDRYIHHSIFIYSLPCVHLLYEILFPLYKYTLEFSFYIVYCTCTKYLGRIYR
jgi:hypothetical protein